MTSDLGRFRLSKTPFSSALGTDQTSEESAGFDPGNSGARSGMFGRGLYRLREFGARAEKIMGMNGTPANVAQSNNFCDLPLPGGGTIRQNVNDIATTVSMMKHAYALIGHDPNTADHDIFTYWLSSVSPGGRWAGRLGEPAGNQNYGATGRAVGLPLAALLRGAGAAERLEAITGRTGSDAKGKGSPFGASPYGDTENGQEQIKQGYYAKCD